MFQDIGVSKNLIDQYRTYCEKRKLDDIGKNSLNFYFLFHIVFFLS
jgi:hypothetical protein